MKVLNVGLMVAGQPYKGLEQDLSLIASEYKSIPLNTPNLDAEIIQTAKEFQPDIIFFQLQREGVVKIETFKELYELNIKVINWTGDVRTPIPQHYYNTAPYCITAFSNMNDVFEMREFGFKAEFLQIGYDPKVFFKKERIEKDIDIVFMGNNYREMFPLSKLRTEMVTRMKKEFGDRFHIYGNGWENGNGDLNGNQNAENDIYNRAKIGINLSHFDYSHYSSDRMYRLMGSGCFCLSHFYKSMETDFVVGTDVISWESIDELITKCHAWLNNTSIRDRVAENGQKWVYGKYSYKQMAENILKL